MYKKQQSPVTGLDDVQHKKPGGFYSYLQPAKQASKAKQARQAKQAKANQSKERKKERKKACRRRQRRESFDKVYPVYFPERSDNKWIRQNENKNEKKIKKRGEWMLLYQSTFFEPKTE
jgi:hypothetical protein